jgi:hypothetical protein
MKHRKRSLESTIAGVLMALTLSVPVSAAPVVADPVGDALYKAPAFMDIVRAELTEESGTFVFRMTVAAPIPNDPRVPPPANASIRWAFPIDSDPATFPEGDPFPRNQPGPAEFNTRVFWDGGAFTASLLDRRPLLAGGEAILTPLSFTVSGSEIRVAVPASLVGASSFRWGAVTVYASTAPGGNNGGHFVDTLQPFYSNWP